MATLDFSNSDYVCLLVCPSSASDDGCICAELSHGFCAPCGHISNCPLCEGMMVQLSICHLLKASCIRDLRERGPGELEWLWGLRC